MRRRNSIQSQSDVKAAASIINDGGLVAFPTETVYGLGADATNPWAVARIFEVKNRPSFDPLIVHVSGLSDAVRFVTHVPDAATRLANKFWPGPLTVILPKGPAIPDIVTSGLPGVGIRVPRHPLALELLTACQLPLAAPSANPFGGISPTTAGHVADGLGDGVDMILDGGACAVGVESTVVSFMDDTPVLLRPGGCCIEDIEALIGPVRRLPHSSNPGATPQVSPGLLDRHYAPMTPLHLVDHNETAIPLVGQRCGLLSESSRAAVPGFQLRIDLTSDGSLTEAAAHFFDGLRRLDAAGLDAIMAHRFENSGLGLALNDRLQRASHRS